MYAVYRRIEEVFSEHKKRCCRLRMADIYKQAASDLGYMNHRHIIKIYAYVQKHKFTPEFRRERLLYEQRTKNYSRLYSSDEDKKNIAKIKSARSIARQNSKSEWHYYLYKRYEELAAERAGEKKAKIGIYMDIADEFLLRNHISACNIIAEVRKNLTN